MTSFLIVKSIFVPNEEYLTTNICSIIATNTFFSMYRNKYNKNKTEDSNVLDLHVLYTGWVNHNADYVDRLKDVIYSDNNMYSGIYSDIWVLNYGKYKLYNNTIDFVNHNDRSHDYVIYLDHDIYFDITSIDMFGSLCSSMITNINESSKLGMIAFNQRIDNRHQPDIYSNKIYLNNICLLRSPNHGSIASGAFIIRTSILANLTHFDLITIYGLDDYYLAKKLTDEGYINVVTQDIYVIHPIDNNMKYALWKRDHLLKLILEPKQSNGSDESIKHNYYQEIQESVNFWT